MARAVSDDVSGTVQALYATFASGVAMGFATYASGPLFQEFAGAGYASLKRGKKPAEAKPKKSQATTEGRPDGPGVATKKKKARS